MGLVIGFTCGRSFLISLTCTTPCDLLLQDLSKNRLAAYKNDLPNTFTCTSLLNLPVQVISQSDLPVQVVSPSPVYPAMHWQTPTLHVADSAQSSLTVQPVENEHVVRQTWL